MFFFSLSRSLIVDSFSTRGGGTGLARSAMKDSRHSLEEDDDGGSGDDLKRFANLFRNA